MFNWKKVIATSLVACVMSLSLGDLITRLGAKTRPNPTFTKQLVHQLGTGAKVKVKLVSGKKLRGRIDAIDDQSFLLTPKREVSSRRIAYDEVSQLRLAKLSYRAYETPDPVEAHRVVTALGIGQHVMVKVAGGRKLRGHIQAIKADHFTLRPDRQGTPVHIAFNEVWQVHENLSKGAKIAIIAGVAIAVFFVAIFISCRTGGPGPCG